VVNPSKGDRCRVHARIPIEIKERLVAAQQEHNLGESQLISDLLCIVFGREDLVRTVNLEVMTLKST
jgi:hypothetical protein